MDSLDYRELTRQTLPTLRVGDEIVYFNTDPARHHIFDWKHGQRYTISHIDHSTVRFLGYNSSLNVGGGVIHQIAFPWMIKRFKKVKNVPLEE